jgi:hypothetical protein
MLRSYFITPYGADLAPSKPGRIFRVLCLSSGAFALPFELGIELATEIRHVLPEHRMVAETTTRGPLDAKPKVGGGAAYRGC